MSITKIIGALLMLSPLIALFLLTWKMNGFMTAVAWMGIAIGITALVVFGVYLLFK